MVAQVADGTDHIHRARLCLLQGELARTRAPLVVLHDTYGRRESGVYRRQFFLGKTALQAHHHPQGEQHDNQAETERKRPDTLGNAELTKKRIHGGIPF